MHILLYNINIRTQLIFQSCDPLCVLIFDSVAHAYNELWIRIHRHTVITNVSRELLFVKMRFREMRVIHVLVS